MSKKAAGEKANESVEKAAAVMNARAAKKKKGKALWYNIAIGATVAVTLLAVLLAALGDGSKKRSSSGPSKLDAQVNDRYVISDTNSKGSDNFTAAASPFFDRWTLADMKYGFDGVSVTNMVGMPGAPKNCEIDETLEGGTLQASFDARKQWPNCFTAVHDSGNCTGSYAIAAATSLSQRFCAADEATYPMLRLSAQQVLSCDKKSQGCKGGFADAVWGYLQRRGLYPEECLPYAGKKGAKCETKCDASKKLKPLSYCITGGIKRIKREISSNGPVVVPMRLMKDFLVYKEGVYSPVEEHDFVYGSDGKFITHAVTVLGWGKSKGVAYWIIENSWGTGWGEDGYARVAQGEVLMEHYAMVGTPATAEALEKAEKDKEAAEARKAQEKKERAERDERIRQRRAAREAEEAAKREAEEGEGTEDVDLDLEDIDDAADFEVEDGKESDVAE